jgi:predicted transcriptional regulator
MPVKKNKRAIPPLSAWEMEIMQILWKSDGLTILQAQQAIDRPLGYTTVQTRLNRLVEKGFVGKSPQRPAQYRAAIPPAAVSAGHLDLLLQRVSGGSVVPLITQLMKDRQFSVEEIQELKELINQLDQ